MTSPVWSRFLCLLTLAAASGSRLFASDHALFDQGDFLQFDGGISLAFYDVASDVEIATFSRLDAVTFWVAGDPDLDDLPQEDVLAQAPTYLDEGFGWAVFSDDNGPDALQFSGYDPAPELYDTGLDAGGLGRIYRVRIQLDGRPTAFGKVWIALHEGPWGTGNDGTSVYMMNSGSATGSTGFRRTASAVTPGSWVSDTPDRAIVVEGDPVHWYQGGFSTTASSSITSSVIAVDFELTTPTRLASLDVWLSDTLGGDDGVLNSFDGTLSWAIYDDGGGAPTGSPLAFGHDNSPILVDSRLQDQANTDIVRARIELDGRPSLPAGTYWLALHEGTWLQASDGDSVWWQRATSTFGATAYTAADETAPGNWQAAAGDYAFVLFEDLIFASGFEAGVTCTWNDLPGSGTCP